MTTVVRFFEYLSFCWDRALHNLPMWSWKNYRESWDLCDIGYKLKWG